MFNEDYSDDWPAHWPILAAAQNRNLIEDAVTFYALYDVAYDTYAPRPASIRQWPHVDAAWGRKVGWTDERMAEVITSRDWNETQQLQYHARKALVKHVNTVLPYLRSYMTMTTVGEARYCMEPDTTLPYEERPAAWVGAAEWLQDRGSLTVLAHVRDLHECYDGDADSVSGPLWVNVTEAVIAQRDQTYHPDPVINDILFVDRCWNLQHNSGTLFDKIGWTLWGEWELIFDEVTLTEALCWHGDRARYDKEYLAITTGEAHDLFKSYTERR